MFFPDRIQSIKPSDRVLEVCFGAAHQPRADFLLRMELGSPRTPCHADRAAPAPTEKPSATCRDDRFPFADREFDYAICSQGLEHVRDVDVFTGELARVARRGYLEFPTVYYDYLYDFPDHPTLVFHHEGKLYWMPKSETCLPAFRPVTAFFYQSLAAGHTSMVDALAHWMFQGFEWHDRIRTQRTHSLYDVCYPLNTLEPSRLQASRRRRRWLSWPPRRPRAA